MRVALTEFRELRSPIGKRSTPEWGRIVAHFENCGRHPHNGRGVSFAHFSGDRRSNANVEQVSALGIDIDDGSTTVGDAAAAWDGVLAIAHSTKSSTLDHPRIRIILPYARPVSGEEHYRIWRWAAAEMPNMDASTKDPSRLWFLPAQAKTGPSAVIPMWGPSLDVEAVLDATPPPPPPNTAPIVCGVDNARRVRRARAWLAASEPAVSGQHGHGRTFRVAGKVAKGFDLDPSTALALLSEWNQRCVPPWSLRDLARKVDQALAHSDVVTGSMLVTG